MAKLRVGAHELRIGKMKAARKGRVSMHCGVAVCWGWCVVMGMGGNIADDDDQSALGGALVLAPVIRAA